VVKYSPEGNQLWSTVAFKQSSGDGEVKGLIADALGNVVITGNYTSGSESGFSTAKISTSGQLQWGRSLIGVPGVSAVTIDTNENIYLTGRTPRGTARSNWIAVATFKLQTNGATAWEADFGDWPGSHRGNAICVDNTGNVYVTSVSTNSVTKNDFATIKYNSNGQEQWVKRYNGRGNGDDEATGIAVDTNGNVYVTGYATTPEGGTEIVVLKYSEITNIQKKADGAMRLQFFGSPGQSYSFEGTTNFLNWLVLGSSIADSNGLFQFDDTNAPAFSFRFYRYAPPR
jgi:hypothetical protein